MELSGDAFFSLHCEGSRNFMKQFHGNGTQIAQTPATSPRPNSTPATAARAPNPKYRNLQTAQSNALKKPQSYREYNFQTVPPYFNQLSTQPIPDTIQAYQPTSFMNTATNTIQNPVYCYGAGVPYCPIPTSDANIIMPSSAFPTQTNMSSYSAYDAYPPNYTYFPMPVHHVALHPHLANGTAGPTAKPSYLSYNAGPSPRGHGSAPSGMGAMRGSNPPKDDSSSPTSHSHRTEEKITQFDKRAHTRTRSSQKARSAQISQKYEAQGVGESHQISPTVESPRDLVKEAPTSEVAPV